MKTVLLFFSFVLLGSCQRQAHNESSNPARPGETAPPPDPVVELIHHPIDRANKANLRVLYVLATLREESTTPLETPAAR